MKQYTRIEPTTIQSVGERFKRSVVIKRFRADDGTEHEFTTFHDEGKQSVAVLALTLDDKVVVSRQFRPGRNRYMDEIPGGNVEAGECDLAVAAQRELLEESGYEVGEIKYLGKYGWDSYSNATAHYFFATGCKPAKQRTHEQIEIDQGLTTALISIEQLLKNARSDQMTDAVAVLMAYDDLVAHINKLMP